MPGTHARLSASQAYRWFECPGSVSLIDTLPVPESSVYAKRGTAAHKVIEELFKDGRNPRDFEGQEVEGVELNEEDIDSVIEFLNAVNKIRTRGKFILHSEVKFELPTIHPDLGGTSDLVLMASDLSELHVIDYKHGAGVPVDVVANKQGLIYGLGAISAVCKKHDLLDPDLMGWGEAFSKVFITIIQPRCEHPDGIVRTWEVPNGELDRFANGLKEKAEIVNSPFPKLQAGDHCRWCPALGICPQVENHTLSVAKSEFTHIDKQMTLPSVPTLTIDDLVRIENASKTIKSFLTAVHNQLSAFANAGETVPGYKLVARRANRKWKNEEEAADFCDGYMEFEDVFQLRSPAQIEKKLKKKQKKELQQFIYKPDNGAALVPESDKRKALPPGVQVEFDAITDDSDN